MGRWLSVAADSLPVSLFPGVFQSRCGSDEQIHRFDRRCVEILHGFVADSHAELAMHGCMCRLLQRADYALREPQRCRGIGVRRNDGKLGTAQPADRVGDASLELERPGDVFCDANLVGNAITIAVGAEHDARYRGAVAQRV